MVSIKGFYILWYRVSGKVFCCIAIFFINIEMTLPHWEKMKQKMNTCIKYINFAWLYSIRSSVYQLSMWWPFPKKKTNFYQYLILVVKCVQIDRNNMSNVFASICSADVLWLKPQLPLVYRTLFFAKFLALIFFIKLVTLCLMNVGDYPLFKLKKYYLSLN